MAQVLLSIPWIYWSVLRGMVLTALGILFWVILDTILGNSNNASRSAEPIHEGGLGWLFYTLAAVILTVVAHGHGAPGWVVELMIGAFVLGVLPLYWAFHDGTAGGSSAKR